MAETGVILNKKKRKRFRKFLENTVGLFVGLIIAHSLLLSAAAGDRKFTYSDVPEPHWAYPYIQDLSHREIVYGLPDGSFEPNKPISYAEFLTMVARFENQKLPPAEAGEHWGKPAVRQYRGSLDLKNYHVIFANPDTPIPRLNAVRVLVEALGVSVPIKAEYLVKESPFNDVVLEPLDKVFHVSPNDNDWLINAYALGLISGDDKGNARPEDTITRAEACKIISVATTINQDDILLQPYLITESGIEVKFDCNSASRIYSSMNCFASTLSKFTPEVRQELGSKETKVFITTNSADKYRKSLNSSTLGAYYSQENKICIFLNDIPHVFYDPESTMIHETGHFIWEKVLTQNEKKILKQAYKNGAAKELAYLISGSYCEKSVEEFFSELIDFATYNKKDLSSDNSLASAYAIANQYLINNDTP